MEVRNLLNLIVSFKKFSKPMKIMCFCFLIVFVGACNRVTVEQEVPLIASRIIGSWQVISNSLSIGGPINTSEVENGGVYTFDLDGSFSFKNAENITLNFAGRYELNEELLILSYSKNSEAIIWKLRPEFKEDTIDLHPGGDILCIEGCFFTVQKLD